MRAWLGGDGGGGGHDRTSERRDVGPVLGNLIQPSEHQSMQRQDVLNVREDDTIAANLILEQSVLAGLLARDRNPYDTIARLAAMRIADSLSLSLSRVSLGYLER